MFESDLFTNIVKEAVIAAAHSRLSVARQPLLLGSTAEADSPPARKRPSLRDAASVVVAQIQSGDSHRPSDDVVTAATLNNTVVRSSKKEAVRILQQHVKWIVSEWRTGEPLQMQSDKWVSLASPPHSSGSGGLNLSTIEKMRSRARVDLMENCLVFVWESRRDARDAHRALKAANEVFESAGIAPDMVMAPESYLFVMSGTLVSVTYLPPLKLPLCPASTDASEIVTAAFRRSKQKKFSLPSMPIYRAVDNVAGGLGHHSPLMYVALPTPSSIFFAQRVPVPSRGTISPQSVEEYLQLHSRFSRCESTASALNIVQHSFESDASVAARDRVLSEVLHKDGVNMQHVLTIRNSFLQSIPPYLVKGGGIDTAESVRSRMIIQAFDERLLSRAVLSTLSQSVEEVLSQRMRTNTTTTSIMTVRSVLKIIRSTLIDVSERILASPATILPELVAIKFAQPSSANKESAFAPMNKELLTPSSKALAEVMAFAMDLYGFPCSLTATNKGNESSAVKSRWSISLVDKDGTVAPPRLLSSTVASAGAVSTMTDADVVTEFEERRRLLLLLDEKTVAREVKTMFFQTLGGVTLASMTRDVERIEEPDKRSVVLNDEERERKRLARALEGEEERLQRIQEVSSVEFQRRRRIEREWRESWRHLQLMEEEDEGRTATERLAECRERKLIQFRCDVARESIVELDALLYSAEPSERNGIAHREMSASLALWSEGLVVLSDATRREVYANEELEAAHITRGEYFARSLTALQVESENPWRRQLVTAEEQEWAALVDGPLRDFAALVSRQNQQRRQLLDAEQEARVLFANDETSDRVASLAHGVESFVLGGIRRWEAREHFALCMQLQYMRDLSSIREEETSDRFALQWFESESWDFLRRSEQSGVFYLSNSVVLFSRESTFRQGIQRDALSQFYIHLQQEYRIAQATTTLLSLSMTGLGGLKAIARLEYIDRQIVETFAEEIAQRRQIEGRECVSKTAMLHSPDACRRQLDMCRDAEVHYRKRVAMHEMYERRNVDDEKIDVLYHYSHIEQQRLQAAQQQHLRMYKRKVNEQEELPRKAVAQAELKDRFVLNRIWILSFEESARKEFRRAEHEIFAFYKLRRGVERNVINKTIALTKQQPLHRLEVVEAERRDCIQCLDNQWFRVWIGTQEISSRMALQEHHCRSDVVRQCDAALLADVLERAVRSKVAAQEATLWKSLVLEGKIVSLLLSEQKSRKSLESQQDMVRLEHIEESNGRAHIALEGATGAVELHEWSARHCLTHSMLLPSYTLALEDSTRHLVELDALYASESIRRCMIESEELTSPFIGWQLHHTEAFSRQPIETAERRRFVQLRNWMEPQMEKEINERQTLYNEERRYRECFWEIQEASYRTLLEERYRRFMTVTVPDGMFWITAYEMKTREIILKKEFSAFLTFSLLRLSVVLEPKWRRYIQNEQVRKVECNVLPAMNVNASRLYLVEEERLAREKWVSEESTDRSDIDLHLRYKQFFLPFPATVSSSKWKKNSAQPTRVFPSSPTVEKPSGDAEEVEPIDNDTNNTKTSAAGRSSTWMWTTPLNAMSASLLDDIAYAQRIALERKWAGEWSELLEAWDQLFPRQFDWASGGYARRLVGGVARGSEAIPPRQPQSTRRAQGSTVVVRPLNLMSPHRGAEVDLRSLAQETPPQTKVFVTNFRMLSPPAETIQGALPYIRSAVIEASPFAVNDLTRCVSPPHTLGLPTGREGEPLQHGIVAYSTPRREPPTYQEEDQCEPNQPVAPLHFEEHSRMAKTTRVVKSRTITSEEMTTLYGSGTELYPSPPSKLSSSYGGHSARFPTATSPPPAQLAQQQFGRGVSRKPDFRNAVPW